MTVSVPLLTYQTPKNLFDPKVTYCTIGPYRAINLGRFPFPGEVRKAIKGQSPKTATRNEFGRTTKHSTIKDSMEFVTSAS